MNTKTNLHVGATVRFLNATGGGRVARIQGDTAWVEDEDGFEIPTPIKECVIVEAGDTFIPEIRPPKLIQEKLQQGRSMPSPQEAPRPTPKATPTRPLRPEKDTLSVRLAFLPIDRTKLGITNYEAYLINDSNFTLYYTYLSAVGTGYKLRSSGLLEPNEDILLEEFAPATLNELEQLAFQLLPFSPNRVAKLEEPIAVRLRLDTTKFFKLHAFRPNDYFIDDALLLPIIERGAVQEELEVNAEVLSTALQSPKASKQEKKPAETAKTPRPNEPIIIDLHASEILETTAGLTSRDILEYQLDFFHKTMKEHTQARGRKLIFIHGKGDGILRSSIERELRHKYKTCRFQDASFREYGYGATQVTIG